jgi:nucleoside-diphosphate-sugar epimerase
MGELVLVTGGGGYIGSHLTRMLLARGFRVRVLDNLTYGTDGLEGMIGHPDLELVVGDVCDQTVVERSVKGTSAVIALAAIVGDVACDIDPERTIAINYGATRRLLHACQKARVSRMVFASSCSVYGANGNDLLKEDGHLNPVSLYARTRLLSENFLLRNSGPLEVVILRLSTISGVSQRMRFDLMVNTMTACAIQQGKIRVAGGSQWRPHLHVQDAAAAFAKAMEAPNAGGRIFNVGSESQNFTIAEVAHKIAARVPSVQVEHLANGSDRRSYRVSFDRISSRLGFQPQFTVDDTIEEVAGLLESGSVADFTEERFHNAKWLGANAHARHARSAA